MPSRTSTLAGFTTSITSTTNLNAGIVTATSFVGNVTGTASTATAAATAYGLTGAPNITVGNVTGVAATFTGNVSIAGTLTYEDVTNVDAIGIVTARSGIVVNTGGLVVTAGVSTLGILSATDTRLISVAEKSQILTGTTLSLVYNTGGSNIAIHTNPGADVTLAVTGIPTDSSFNNSVLTFSTVLINTGTARSCTAVTLNGVSASIKWFGGSLANATSGVTTTTGTDIYTFTGINTVGSASTTANYLLLGNVNGSYR